MRGFFITMNVVLNLPLVERCQTTTLKTAANKTVEMDVACFIISILKVSCLKFKVMFLS